MTTQTQSENGMANRSAGYQENRIGIKGDPTPDHEYGDEPEDIHPGRSQSKEVTLKCKNCGSQRKAKRENLDMIQEDGCMRMTFNPEVGEVPCGGEFEVKQNE